MQKHLQPHTNAHILIGTKCIITNNHYEYIRCVIEDTKYLFISAKRGGILHRTNTAVFRAMMAKHTNTNSAGRKMEIIIVQNMEWTY